MKILVYPFDSNPYQTILYSSIKKNKNKVIYLNKVLNKAFPTKFILPFFPFYILFYRIIGFSIFHLHWQSFSLPWKKKIFYKINLFLSKFYIKLIKLYNFKLVWTIHNLIPHEKATSNDLEITRLLCDISNAKIVHSLETIEEMKRLHLNTDNTFIISHGSYVGVYPNNKKDTKSKFGFSKDDFVFLFIGGIREYKGIPELLQSFSKIRDKNIRLLVAGNCSDANSRLILEKCSRKDKRIIFIEGFIKDEEIQDYMNASDIVVYPFRRITTSGSVILASSFAKPIIYPLIGGLKELPKDIGFYYNNKDKYGLLDSMKKAIDSKNNLDKLAKNSFNYAKKLSWKNIARKTSNVYISL